MIQSGVDQNRTTKWHIFFCYTVSNKALVLHSLWNCVAILKITLVNIMKCSPSWHSRNREIFGHEQSIQFNVSNSIQFEWFWTICEWVYDFKKISAQMKFNTCCHTIICCTLLCNSFNSIGLDIVRVRWWCVQVCENEGFHFKSVNWCIRYAKWNRKKMHCFVHRARGALCNYLLGRQSDCVWCIECQPV